MKYIVTLTSFGNRLERTAPYAICSLLSQSVTPDRIILWVKTNTAIPPIIKKLASIGLEIKFCEDFRSYTKLVPALLEFPNDVLVSADDDVYYPKEWFAQLKSAFLNDPSRIYTHRAHEIIVNENHEILPYQNWSFCKDQIEDEAAIFPTGVGGILYPRGSLHEMVADSHTFLSLSPTADDIWFWAMARLKGSRYSIVKNGYKSIVCVDPSDNGMWPYNISQGGNDKQMNNILKRFPILYEGFKKLKGANSVNRII